VVLHFLTTAPPLSEALAVDDGHAGVVVFVARDPHLCKRRQGGQDGATNPHAEEALGRGGNLDLHGGRGKVREFLVETLWEAREELRVGGLEEQRRTQQRKMSAVT